MTASTARGGHFLMSMRSASMSCFKSLAWSSSSRMVKLGRSPTTSAWLRRMRALSAWKVPIHHPSTGLPRMCATRSFISRAALLVKVTASMSQGLALPSTTMWARRVTSTRVLPVPAPASTRTGPSVALTASSWPSLRPSR